VHTRFVLLHFEDAKFVATDQDSGLFVLLAAHIMGIELEMKPTELMHLLNFWLRRIKPEEDTLFEETQIGAHASLRGRMSDRISLLFGLDGSCSSTYLPHHDLGARLCNVGKYPMPASHSALSR